MNQVEALFIKIINYQLVNDNSFSQWQKTIIIFVPKINKKKSGFLTKFCNDLFSNITNLSVVIAISDSRRKDYLFVLTTLIKTSKDESLKMDLGQKLMSLLKNKEPVLQKMGTDSLSATKEILSNFRIYLNTTVKELCNKPSNEISTFKESILKSIDFQKSWDPEAEGAPGPKPAAWIRRAWLSRYIFVVVSELNALD